MASSLELRVERRPILALEAINLRNVFHVPSDSIYKPALFMILGLILLAFG
jgi:hypothetical protein